MADPRQREEQNRPSERPQPDTDPVKKQQQQTDPQITELKGFVDPNEELEPRLEDGTKAPEKEG